MTIEAMFRGPVFEELEKVRAENARLREEVDCGQDGVCAKAPGCRHHWEERTRGLAEENARLRAAIKEIRQATLRLEPNPIAIVGLMDDVERIEARALKPAKETP